MFEVGSLSLQGQEAENLLEKYVGKLGPTGNPPQADQEVPEEMGSSSGHTEFSRHPCSISLCDRTPSGASAISSCLQYSERVKGLISLSCRALLRKLWTRHWPDYAVRETLSYQPTAGTTMFPTYPLLRRFQDRVEVRAGTSKH